MRQLTRSLIPSASLVLGAGALALALSALVSSAAPGAGGGDGPAITGTHALTLRGAERVIEAAQAEAASRGAGGAIAVVDAGGHLVALHRLDNTFPAASVVAIEKARSAALFRKPTAAFEDAVRDGRQALLGVDVLTPLRGGVPIMHEGVVVGAVGISGARSAQEDEELATIGAGAVAGSR